MMFYAFWNKLQLSISHLHIRPLGAIMFGEIGDRLVGRKHALVFSILLITVPSVLMGMLPGYATWGALSPVLLVILRMMQGLSVGGQLAGSYVISIEQSSSRSRGFRGSVCDASSVRVLVLTTFPDAIFCDFVLIKACLYPIRSEAFSWHLQLHLVFDMRCPTSKWMIGAGVYHSFFHCYWLLFFTML